MGVPLQCSAILVRERVRLLHTILHKHHQTTTSVLLLSPNLKVSFTLTVSNCRDYYKAATPCVLVTCSSKTNSMTSRTTQAIKPFNVDATSISSSSGSCGKQRWEFYQLVSSKASRKCNILSEMVTSYSFSIYLKGNSRI